MTMGLYKLTAGDVMTRQAETIRANENIRQAIEAMVNLGLSALPVVNDDGECEGVITKTDIIKLAGHLEHEDALATRQDLSALIFGVGLNEITDAKVENVMTKLVVSVTEDDPLTTVAQEMLKHEVHHLPVCNVRQHVVGIVSSMDLVKAISDSARS